jgi:aminopeptidase
MDSRIQKMAQVLVQYSVAVKPGDRVLFRGTSPLAQPLMQALTEEALKAGGMVSNYVHMSREEETLLNAGSVEQLEMGNPMLKLMYETANVIIRIEAEEDSSALSKYPMDKQQARARARGEWLAIQMRREAAGELRRCTTQFPTENYAKDAGMALTDYENFVYGACMLHLEDPVAYWKDFAAKQQRLCDYLKGKKRIAVQGKNIDLTMSIDGRIFENADGTSNFPDGEIFTGPVEDSVEGWVRFTYPAIYNGNTVRGAYLRFEKGKVVEAKADENEAFLRAMLDTDEGARRLGEFAIGTNTFIDRFTGSILFDEKINGTVHMAVGQSYATTGGVNKSSIHWDLICDMRDGVIDVDGQRFYEGGKFLVG